MMCISKCKTCGYPQNGPTCENCAKRITELEAELEAVKKTCKAVSKCHDQEAEHNAELAEEIEQLRDKLALKDKTIRELKRQITIKDESLHRKNKELDALGMVWCSGGCKGGMFRYTEKQMTQEIIDMVNRNTERLNRWWRTAKAKED